MFDAFDGRYGVEAGIKEGKWLIHVGRLEGDLGDGRVGRDIGGGDLVSTFEQPAREGTGAAGDVQDLAFGHTGVEQAVGFVVRAGGC